MSDPPPPRTPASPQARATGIGRTVGALCAANHGLLRGGLRKLERRALPSRERIASAVADLCGVLFPWHFGAPDVSEQGLAYYVGHTLERALSSLGSDATKVRRAARRPSAACRSGTGRARTRPAR